ncbi:Ser-tRNA(Ala) deacylase AlaX (editing enzyme) [Arthrobacter subterraneus]|uniref:Ser-tRNA(Ala) deacylase AlaX (Editing enzyme) n=1 Tax=Arthrobacter subterraneus TaxID=335973 RepID=A0A1G8M6B0_9MICC|nr:alanine--tRNA ligase-related protein [Arthrobacter subterraneus]SDI63482.1 Ser-tRNA(Ala) deacylase AlaX (editing enzyme) [Arthrobacter subterraneus]
MATELLYLDDFNVLTASATVTAVTALDDGRTDIELDRTCFYPRGGGQDWDTGTIRAGDDAFTVQEVRLDEHQVVHHLGEGNLSVGAAVVLEVDAEQRAVNTRLHSAGHIVDLAVERLGLPWVPGKGAHYPHMSFVEYNGELPGDAEEIRQRVEQEVTAVIAEGSRNEIRFMPVAEMGDYCRHVPDNIPTNKPARIVLYNADFGVPCGGTHVQDVAEVGKLNITKVRSKKGITKVSYAVDGIN